MTLDLTWMHGAAPIGALLLVAAGYGVARVQATRRGMALHATLAARATEALRQKDDLAEKNAELSDAIERLEAKSHDLDAARVRAEEASIAKSDFLANVSHEIRTPMTAILGMADLALDTRPTAEQAKYLRAVKSSADHLLALINDILDVSKVEAGRLELSPVAFRLRETIADTLRLLARPAHAKGLELTCAVDRHVPDFLIGDSGRLRQLVLNLAGNAIKFTTRGEVVVRVTSDRTTAEDLALRLSVSDTGVGIAPDKQRAVFGAFEQADGSTTRRYGGTGLGLTICSHLADLMDGRIWLESEVGLGSTFHVTLRLGRQARPTARPGLTPPAALRGKRILVVDDNPTSRRVTLDMLDGWQLRTDEADSGHQALETIRSAAEASDAFDAIVLDARMPAPDGFAVAEAVGLMLEPRPALVMLLTTSDERRDVARCRSLDVTATITKPVAHHELLTELSAALGLETGGPTTRDVRADIDGPRRSLRILVAEDNELNQELIATLLRKRGHASVVVGDGRQALERLDAEPFDVVLMDIQMPGLDGLEATRTLRTRERPTGRHLPVVAITAGTLQGDRERCLEAGMDALVAKPIDAVELFETIETLTGAQPAPAPAAHESQAPLVRTAELIDRLAGDMDLLARMVEAFLADCPTAIGTLEVAIRRQDARALELAAHRLKGAVGNFCAPEVAACAATLERIGRHGDLSSAEEHYEHLHPMLDELRRTLTRLVRTREELPTGRTA